MSDRWKHPKKYLTRAVRKWRVIDKNKYPRTGIVDDFFYCNTLTCEKIIGYMKGNVMCFYWGVSKIKFTPMDCKEIIFKIHRDAYNKIKEWVEKNNYKGKVGFELCELEQLNVVVEYMIKRFGYNPVRENGFLIVDLKE